MTAFLTAHAGAIFWTGVAIETIGFVWFLFDSYRCDVDIARWTLLFPHWASTSPSATRRNASSRSSCASSASHS